MDQTPNLGLHTRGPLSFTTLPDGVEVWDTDANMEKLDSVIGGTSVAGATPDAQVALQASWANNSLTITLGANDPPFSSADVGKIIFGVSNCQQPNGYINGTTCFYGTIVAVMSPTTCTISRATTRASSAAEPSGFTGWVIWGTDNTAALQAAWAATLATPGQILTLPKGMMIVTGSPFISLNGSTYNTGIQGAGPHSSSSVIIPAPQFNYAGAANALIYYDAGVNATRLWTSGDDYDQTAFVYTTLKNFTIWGGGQDGAAVTVTLPAIFAQNAHLENVWVVGWNWNLGNTTNTAPGMTIEGAILENCGVWSAGNYGLNVANAGPRSQNMNQVIGGLFGVCSGAGAIIRSGGQFGNHLQTFGVQFVGSAASNACYGVYQTGGTWESFGDQSGGVNINAGVAHLYSLYDDFLGDYSVTITGGTVTAENCQIDALIMTSGSFTDLGGNFAPVTLHSLGPFVSWTASTRNNISGGNVFGTGSVTGAAAAAANITASTGWGTSGAAGNGVSAVSGNTKQIQFTITAAGTPTPSPQITVSFPTPFATPPICQLKQAGGTNFSDVTNPVASAGPTASSVTFTLSGTAVAGHTYVFQLFSDLA